MKKHKLEKLLQLVTELTKLPGNGWFKSKLLMSLGSDLSNIENSSLEEIYEFCIEMIIKDQATKFYENFKIEPLKESLIQDFIRMERFRRKDEFEDFCLAAFQQIEAIVNHLVAAQVFIDRFNSLKESPSFMKYNPTTKSFFRDGGQTVESHIFMSKDKNKIDGYNKKEPIDWYFNHRLRAVLYFFYFHEELKFNSKDFDLIFTTANQLYLIRNTNHRGGTSSDYQERIKKEVLSNFNRYYFKFLGFLESFVYSVNEDKKLEMV